MIGLIHTIKYLKPKMVLHVLTMRKCIGMYLFQDNNKFFIAQSFRSIQISRY